MDCNNCEDDICAMKMEKYKGMYPCMVCEHIRTAEINEYCVMCIKRQVCCFKEAVVSDSIM